MTKTVLLLGHVTDEQVALIKTEMPGLDPVVSTWRSPDAADLVRDAHIIYGYISKELFVQASHLEWIHLVSMGAENMLFPELVDSPVILTCGRGTFSQACAEHALMMILALYRDLPLLLRHQQDAAWCAELFEMDLLFGKTVACIGTGSIGQCVAKLCKAFDCSVTGYNRTGGANRHFTRIYSGVEGLHECLAEADVVVNSLPDTPDTHHIIGADEFAVMKPATVFTNVGRGRTVDENALIEALRAGGIAGAGLDVTEREPLPSDSPLWKMDNVLVTSHNAGRGGADEQTRSFNLLIDNLRRYTNGDPLLHIVDKQARY